MYESPKKTVGTGSAGAAPAEPAGTASARQPPSATAAAANRRAFGVIEIVRVAMGMAVPFHRKQGGETNRI
ncbi:hypothetical protein Shyd_01750 [Streptomyces hydrogenans]|uniref:Uncharacterized protein n=1 Tax=Streptomyces hydrogenans TaxID=1873719 RepID=A0ABQ3P1B0_9ACTN|nr:hypothetical protein GCM10018784_49140 [Streptomyces hydrogenans]GHI18804.1 hypothetical protein Shyd_01750 [Streptomyces hydrogenans]